MAKLNQVLAVSKTVKNETMRALTKAHQDVQKPALMSGIIRTYQAIDEDGETLPPESAKVQLKAEAVIQDVKAQLSRLFQVTGTIDMTNSQARADVIVDGQVLLTGVPATHLLFLEKQLVDLHTFVAKLPVLDPQWEWEMDPNIGVFTTDARTTSRTKKVPKTHVAYPATPEHPAQVVSYQEDIISGYWTTRNLSGALRQTDVSQMLRRVSLLQEAVKKAREEANMAPVSDFSSAPILEFLFG